MKEIEFPPLPRYVLFLQTNALNTLVKHLKVSLFFFKHLFNITHATESEKKKKSTSKKKKQTKYIKLQNLTDKVTN